MTIHRKLERDFLLKYMRQSYLRLQKSEKIAIKTHFVNWKEKHLHRQYLIDRGNKVDNENTWKCLQNECLKKEMEGCILAAQGQALETNSMNTMI